MEIHTISQQNMDAVKALAETNIKVSQAKTLLFKLQEEETEYLVSREQKAITRINSLYEESKQIFKDISENYQGAQDILKEVSNAVTFLAEAHAKFSSLLSDFEQTNKLWDKKVKTQEENFARIKQEIATDKVLIKNDKEGIERAKLKMIEEQKKIDDARKLLERNIIRFREGKI